VVEVIENKIYEIFPDGTKKYIKDIDLPIETKQKVFTI